MTNRGRIILFITVVLVVGGGIAAYLLLSVPGAPGRPFLPDLPIIGGRTPSGTPEPEPPAGDQAGRAQGTARLRQIIDRDILAPAIGPDTRSLLFVDRANGHIIASDLDGAGETIRANLTILETFEGVWSPLKTKVALFYHENGIVKKFVEAAATGTPSKFLPQDITSFAWSPDGREMAYLLRQGTQTNLVTADQNNSGPRVVFSTPIPDFTLQWISRNTMLLVSRPSGLAPSLTLLLDLATRRAEPILGERQGLITLPLPNASGFVFSQSLNRGEAGTLARYAFRDAAVTSLDIVTLADKCVPAPDSKNIFCGVPQGTISAPAPDEWYRGAVSFSDRILEIELATGRTATLMENEADVDVMAPFVSEGGRYLFFQNKKDGTLWRLTLKE